MRSITTPATSRISSKVTQCLESHSKGENAEEAKKVMRRRMKLALGIFAEHKAKHLVLGAYGCGVFRNDPKEVAIWWRELLEEGMGQYFDSVFHAVLDSSKDRRCIKAFQEQLITPAPDR